MDFKKQQNRWNQIRRERKYRPSFFGLSVHFDWKLILISLLIALVAITSFGLFMQRKIVEISNKDYSSEVQIINTDKIEIEKYNEILDSLEK
jgi:hypothetical protein